MDGATEPTLTPKLVLRVNRIWHDVEAEHYDRVHHEIITDEAEHWAKLAERAAACLPASPATIVDLGVGTGFATAAFWPHLRPGDRAVCLDISVPMLRKAEARIGALSQPGRAVLIACDAGRAPLPSGGTHVVLMNSVLHHMPEPDNVLAEVDRLLAPGGVFVLAHEPNARARCSPVALLLLLVYRVWRKLRRVARGVIRRTEPVGELPTEVYDEVIRRLREQKVIAPGQEVTRRWVSQSVDFHSPTAGGAVMRAGGFDPVRLASEHFPRYHVVSVETYAHLGKIRPTGRLLGAMDRLIGKVAPRCGSGFSLILRKEDCGKRS